MNSFACCVLLRLAAFLHFAPLAALRCPAPPDLAHLPVALHPTPERNSVHKGLSENPNPLRVFLGNFLNSHIYVRAHMLLFLCHYHLAFTSAYFCTHAGLHDARYLEPPEGFDGLTGDELYEAQAWHKPSHAAV